MEDISGVCSSYSDLVNDCFKSNNVQALSSVGTQIAHSTVPVISSGGTFSTIIAWHFHMHLRVLRKNCVFVDARIDRQSELLDVKPSSIGVIFDFRRYQPDTFEFAQGIKSRGGRIVLVTDPFLSPIAELADHLLTVKSDVTAPFDSAVGAIVLAELLIQRIYEELGPSMRKRLKDFDDLRTDI
jgi:DNA-binding MurR/RpiR family transcriptional regulator